MEIFFRKILHYFTTVTLGNHFLRLLNSTASQYIRCIRTNCNPYQFHLLQENVWSFLRSKCASLVPMDSSAQFSEIFQASVFGHLSGPEKNIIYSGYKHVSYCDNCVQEVCISNDDIFLHYLSLEQILSNSLSPQNWTSLVEGNLISKSIKCLQCERQCVVTDSEYCLSKLLFVEMSVGLISVVNFEETITVMTVQYDLIAIVKHLGAHFTCAIRENGNMWVLYDDMSEKCYSYASLGKLYESHPTGWFFAVYAKSEIVQNETNTSRFVDHDYCVPFKSDIDFSINKHDEYDDCQTAKSSTHASQKLYKNIISNPAVPNKKRKLDFKIQENEKSTVRGCNTPLNHDPTVVKELQKFHDNLKMCILQCTICFEAWPLTVNSKKDKNNYICTRCTKDKGSPKKFSVENNTIPSVVPSELQGLSQCEEMLIARAFPVMQVYVKHRYGSISYKGHCVTLPHNVQIVANVLPHIPSEIPIVVFAAKGQKGSDSNFRVRRARVLDALLWLKNNNALYSHIIIDSQRIAALPVDDFVELNKTIETETDMSLPDNGPVTEQELTSDLLTSSFFPTNSRQPLEWDRIQNTLNDTNYIDIGTNPFNEFSTPCLATLAFPTLFPDGKGDPTNHALLRQVSANETESFSLQLKHLIKFAEKIDGRWVYRFATHPRFGYWAYNILYRKRLIGQGNFYIKQNLSEKTTPTIDDLRDMLDTNNYQTLLKKYSIMLRM